MKRACLNTSAFGLQAGMESRFRERRSRGPPYGRGPGLECVRVPHRSLTGPCRGPRFLKKQNDLRLRMHPCRDRARLPFPATAISAHRGGGNED